MRPVAPRAARKAPTAAGVSPFGSTVTAMIADLIRPGPQPPLGGGEARDDQRADVGTVRVDERDESGLAAQSGERDPGARVVAQRERRRRLGRLQDQPCSPEPPVDPPLVAAVLEDPHPAQQQGEQRAHRPAPATRTASPRGWRRSSAHQEPRRRRLRRRTPPRRLLILTQPAVEPDEHEQRHRQRARHEHHAGGDLLVGERRDARPGGARGARRPDTAATARTRARARAPSRRPPRRAM